MNNEEYPKEQDFDKELQNFVECAPKFNPFKINDFRVNISNLVAHTCNGFRSVPGFIKISTALKEAEPQFEQYSINISNLVIVSLKTRDVHVESEREANATEPEIKKKAENLVNMVKGLLVNISFPPFFSLFLQKPHQNQLYIMTLWLLNLDDNKKKSNLFKLIDLPLYEIHPIFRKLKSSITTFVSFTSLVSYYLIVK